MRATSTSAFRTRAWVRLGAAGVVLGLAIGAMTVIPAQVASAATLTVTNCNDAGAGSLRAAVASASSGDTITFALSPACSTITLTSGEIPIFQSLNIEGPGARALTVMSDPNGNFVQMENAANVAISGLSMQGGPESILVYDTSTGTVNVTNSAVLNAAVGIKNGSTGTLNVANSTFSGNSYAIENDTATLSVTNSTESANGVGIYNRGGGTMNVAQSTLSGDNTGISNGGGGAVNVTGSIIAKSSPDCANPITDKGYNIDDDGSCGFSATGSISHSTTLDASLGTLADNGGPTQTMLPATGSPAIGVIPPGTTLNSVSLCPRTDQRGVASTSGANCTIGAVEVPASLCAAGLNAHVLTATYHSGTFTGLFCVNAKGVGTYTQGTVSGFGAVTTWKGTTFIGAVGKHLFLLGATNGTTSSFGELAPTPSHGTFTLS
jgi:hypothetical protein